MARTNVVWTDVVRCDTCGKVNDARDEWCESCLSDLPSDSSDMMFVRRWAQRRRPERPRRHRESA
jgi:hypothetical protein